MYYHYTISAWRGVLPVYFRHPKHVLYTRACSLVDRIGIEPIIQACKARVSPTTLTALNWDQPPALPGPGLSCYPVRMSAYGVDITHPRYFQGTRLWVLEVVAKLYRAHPGGVVTPIPPFYKVKG